MKWMEKRQGYATKTLLCIPLCEKNKEALLESAKKAMNDYASFFDYVEWRLDIYESWKELDDVMGVVEQLSSIFIDKGLIVTIRTQEEGGQAKCSKEDYISHLLALASVPEIHYLDVQVFSDTISSIKACVNSIQRAGTKVIGSYHDFHKTPSNDEIIERFMTMQETGVDVAKMAVMPKESKDVLRFMQVVELINTQYVKLPVIAMSMGRLGASSRITGYLTGSVLSFASVTQASAPGQIHIEQMALIGEVLEG